MLSHAAFTTDMWHQNDTLSFYGSEAQGHGELHVVTQLVKAEMHQRGLHIYSEQTPS